MQGISKAFEVLPSLMGKSSSCKFKQQVNVGTDLNKASNVILGVAQNKEVEGEATPLELGTPTRPIKKSYIVYL